MRQLLVLFISFLSIFQCYSQPIEKAPLRFQSYGYSLCVSKKEQLTIATRIGEVAIASSPESFWRKLDPVKQGKNGMTFGATLDQANFFNNDTGFVSGFINEGGGYDIIYHTSDGGNNWKKIDFGKGGWVDDATNLDNGEAWMSVSGNGIAYTSNYGFKWTSFNTPVPKQRFAKIYFNTERQGLIGSLWNTLAYTGDNCESWKLLPTPLDQKKYDKINKENRPEIDRVAIFGNYFLVSQENLVFYSKRDTIDWIWLKGYKDFYTDAENTALYCKTIKENFVRMNQSLEVEYIYKSKGSTYDAKCRNSKLFVMCGDKIMKLDIDNSIASFPIYTNQTEQIEPEMMGYSTEGAYGSIGNKVYIQKGFSGNWEYKFTLPFAIDSGRLSLINEKTILYQQIDSLIYFDLDYQSVRYKSARKIISDFSSSNIRKIVFNKGSQGCFHHISDDLIYQVNSDEEFELAKNSLITTPKGKDFSLPSNNDIFDKAIVDSFIRKIPFIIDKWASVEELGFTESDYEQCKKDILSFRTVAGNKKKKGSEPFQFYVNNLDFDKLLRIVDTVKYIKKIELNNILFNLSEMWSTSSSWTKVTFTNLMGEELTISNNYYAPNSLNFPWHVSFGGVSYYNTSVEINQFLTDVYPEFLNNKTSKMDILYTIVKRLYNNDASGLPDE